MKKEYLIYYIYIHTSNDYHKKWRGAVFALLIPPRYSSQGLFLISQTIRNDGALSFIVCAKKTKIYTARNKGREASPTAAVPLHHATARSSRD